ncbi:TRAP transporter small permease [Rhodobacter sp. 24-YEA-8]|uniref:TRAP transporter small permease n=1 Tax=Rhodobacter sp. 24-YEA-8 TaxID=1884310 RepID=UPI0008942D7B|nr:TRAP transporter small permease [Rhodobacter sp. 24-YEA-8]SED61714.1 TRAP-type C4-dicarboxylate transport system, small permease component [Rhodobacter sp. 24-YEA-8]
MSVHSLFSLYRKVIGAFAFACMVGIVLLTALQVVSRYALQSALFWPEEAARFLLILITFIVAGLSYDRGEMIGVTIFTQRFSRRIALVFSVLVHLSMLTLLGLLIWYGWQFAQMNAVQKAAALRIPMQWIYMAVPVGFAILACHVLGNLLCTLRELARPKGDLA